MKRTPLRRRRWIRRVGSLARFGRRARRRAESLERFREALLSRAGGRCERCRVETDLHAHHILPRARGGGDEPENGAALCFRCHVAIHDHTAEDWKAWVW